MLCRVLGGLLALTFAMPLLTADGFRTFLDF